MATLAPEDVTALGLDIKAEEVKRELIGKYPTKVARKRAKQIVINEVGPNSCVPEIASNVRTIPGIISQRGCTYAGCKGVVLGPTRDIVNITHGPIGCGFYSWLTHKIMVFRVLGLGLVPPGQCWLNNDWCTKCARQ